MERVQYQQEHMLAELKDLEQKGLFSKSEIKSIVKTRTTYERALVRRIPKKADFLRYVEYEMGLEALRRRRVKRLNMANAPSSLSDFALVRRQFHIFERALRKFKADIGLWIQYIELAKREGAHALVGRISAKALSLHPSHPALYIYAAQHELSNNLSPSAARTLLQRGIRLNKDDVGLWREYVKFEMGWVESVRRRWGVLGVNEGRLGEGEGGEEMEKTSEVARKEIMQGAIVKAVVAEAAKALPNLELFQTLHILISTYPSPESLRISLISYLHILLIEKLPSDPAALKFHAGRFLPASGEPEETEDFVDNLRNASDELLGYAREKQGEVAAVYADFVQEWCQKDLEPNLKLYLMACLQSLTTLPDVAPRVLAVHVRLLVGKRAVQRARKYTARHGAKEDAGLWLARLDAERMVGATEDETCRIWCEARKWVKGTEEDIERVWMWGLSYIDARERCEGLLKESIAAGPPGLHTRLLIYYYTRILDPRTAETRLANVRQIISKYLVTPAFLRAAFEHEASSEDVSEAVLWVIYEEWRGRDGEAVDATIRIGKWLLGIGQGGRAAELISGTKGTEARWSRVLAEEHAD